METHRSNGTLSVSDVRELSAANAGSFRDQVCALLAPELKNIEIDLSQTSLVDSCGLGALVSVHNAAKGHVRMRLLNPFAVGAASLRTDPPAPPFRHRADDLIDLRFAICDLRFSSQSPLS